MRTAIKKWFVEAWSPQAREYLAELETQSLANFERRETSMGMGLWECSFQQIEILRAEPLAKKLYFELFIQLEGSSRIETFHRR
jgi:hypothetical protein